jgi:hypothetical protein
MSNDAKTAADLINTRDELEQTAATRILGHLGKGGQGTIQDYLENIQKPDLKPEDLVRETRNLVSYAWQEEAGRTNTPALSAAMQMDKDIEAYAKRQGIPPLLDQDATNTRDKLAQITSNLHEMRDMGEEKIKMIESYRKDIQNPTLKSADLISETRKLLSSLGPNPTSDKRDLADIKKMGNEIESYAQRQGIGPAAPVPVPPGLASPNVAPPKP